jgi:hypothetical protein
MEIPQKTADKEELAAVARAVMSNAVPDIGGILKARQRRGEPKPGAPYVRGT